MALLKLFKRRSLSDKLKSKNAGDGTYAFITSDMKLLGIGRDVKRIMPTTMSSAELARLEVAVRERAMFSARTTNEHYLEEIARVVREILNPRTAVRGADDPHGREGEAFTEGMDLATARLRRGPPRYQRRMAPTGQRLSVTRPLQLPGIWLNTIAPVEGTLTFLWWTPALKFTGTTK